MTYDLAEQAAHDERISVGFGSWGSSAPKFRVYGAENRIEIGSYCALGFDVTIFAGGTHPYKLLTQHHLKLLFGLETMEEWAAASPSRTHITRIGSDVWIGEGAMILSGVTIGHGAVIGANAVVDKDVPPFAIAIGNRAKIAKYRFDKAVIDSLCRLQWWGWHRDHVKAAANIIASRDIKKLEQYFRDNENVVHSPIGRRTKRSARKS